MRRWSAKRMVRRSKPSLLQEGLFLCLADPLSERRVMAAHGDTATHQLLCGNCLLRVRALEASAVACEEQGQSIAV